MKGHMRDGLCPGSTGLDRRPEGRPAFDLLGSARLISKDKGNGQLLLSHESTLQPTNPMTTGSQIEVLDQTAAINQGRGKPRLRRLAFIGAVGLAFVAAITGCQETAVPTPIAQFNNQPEVLTIREGDGLKITFPSAPNLDTTQQVRRDGRVTLAMVGEVMAAGLTPGGLEQELVKLYSSQLVSKEVSVTVVSSSFSVFVSGAVIRPGKISSDHPLSALEAVMEAGGFDNAKANMRAVVVTRQEAGQYKNYVLDLKLVLDGKQTQPFLLRPSDIVNVPEKYSWF